MPGMAGATRLPMDGCAKRRGASPGSIPRGRRYPRMRARPASSRKTANSIVRLERAVAQRRPSQSAPTGFPGVAKRSRRQPPSWSTGCSILGQTPLRKEPTQVWPTQHRTSRPVEKQQRRQPQPENKLRTKRPTLAPEKLSIHCSFDSAGAIKPHNAAVDRPHADVSNARHVQNAAAQVPRSRDAVSRAAPTACSAIARDQASARFAQAFGRPIGRRSRWWLR